MKQLFAALVALILCACDTVTDHYGTLEEARKDRLFERGWLPDILPVTSVDIVTSNELDLNYSIGSFDFAVEDGPKFFAQLEKGPPSTTKFKNWSEIVGKYPLETYSQWSYKNDRGNWAFFCIESEATCEYYGW